MSASWTCETVVEQVAEVHMCMPMCPNRSQGRSRETSRRILQTKQGFVQHVICLQAGTTRTIMHVYMSKVCVSVSLYTYIYLYIYIYNVYWEFPTKADPNLVPLILYRTISISTRHEIGDLSLVPWIAGSLL